MQQMFDEEDSLNQSHPLYHCNSCKSAAKHPVLPPCGHLYCWKCAYQQNICLACENPFKHTELFSVFIESADIVDDLPDRPKPIHKGKIRNSGISSSGDSIGMKNQNNLQMQVNLAGYGYLPPLVLASLSDLDSMNEEQELVKSPMLRLQLLLIVVIAILLIFS